MQRSRSAGRLLYPALLLGMLLLPHVAQAQDAQSRDLVLVLDASGSMWGRMEGTEKIVVARNVLGGLIDGLPETEVALVAYGHRREGDCDDIETIVPLASLDRGALKAAVNGLNPKGKTPLTASTQAAIDLVKASQTPATVILVSDGVETCGGDPCATVRAAREAGVDFVLHVVGFGIEEGDVAPLECAAQAGGGLYFPADDAGALEAALDKALEPPVEPDARLLVKAVGDDGLVDALVIVTRGGEGPVEDVAAGRTYNHGETNPRVFGLAAGTYDVKVVAVRIPGAAPVLFEGVELKDGDEVEHVADFSGGEISVKVTSNGELSDAAVTLRRAGTTDQVTAGRTYRASSSNPRVLPATAGTYDVEIGSVEIAGKPTHVWTSIEVSGGATVELSHDFPAGVLKVGATAGGELVDAGVTIKPAAGGSQVAGGRTYTDTKSNPKSFTLSPGSYTVTVKPVRLKGVDAYETTVQVEAGGTAEVAASFESGG